MHANETLFEAKNMILACSHGLHKTTVYDIRAEYQRFI